MHARLTHLALVAIAISVGSTAIAQEEPGGDERSLPQLMEEREAILGKLVDIARTRYRQGEATLDLVIDAEQNLLAARFDAATTARQRIEIRESQLELATQRENEVAKLVDTGNVGPVDLLQAKAYRLTAAIALERERQRQVSTSDNDRPPTLDERIEIAEQRLAIRRQEVAVAKAERQRLAGDTGQERILVAKEKVDAARRQFTRAEELHREGLTHQVKVQQAENELRTAEAELTAHEAYHVARTHGHSVADTRIELLELRAKLAETRLEHLRKRAR